MALPPAVEATVSAYLQAVDAEVDGLEGLYLLGSVALGDFRPEASDVDFVAVTAQRPTAEVIVALEGVHSALRLRRRRPFFDGAYVTWSDLATDPTRLRQGAHTHEGRFRAAGDGMLDPIAWHTLARHGVTCRGPLPPEIDIWTDPAGLAAWTNDNLDRYWRRFLNRGSRLLTPFGLYGLSDYATIWTVTGVSRLHYTLATGDITSKEGAALYALGAFSPRWHRVLNEALRLRRAEGGPSLYPSPLTRRRDVWAFGDMVITEAHHLYASRWR